MVAVRRQMLVVVVVDQVVLVRQEEVISQVRREVQVLQVLILEHQ